MRRADACCNIVIFNINIIIVHKKVLQKFFLIIRVHKYLPYLRLTSFPQAFIHLWTISGLLGKGKNLILFSFVLSLRFLHPLTLHVTIIVKKKFMMPFHYNVCYYPTWMVAWSTAMSAQNKSKIGMRNKHTSVFISPCSSAMTARAPRAAT